MGAKVVRTAQPPTWAIEPRHESAFVATFTPDVRRPSFPVDTFIACDMGNAVEHTEHV